MFVAKQPCVGKKASSPLQAPAFNPRTEQGSARGFRERAKS